MLQTIEVIRRQERPECRSADFGRKWCGCCCRKADGTFVFADLVPGRYRLDVYKDSTERKDEAIVAVEAGTTAAPKILLYR